MSLTNLFYHIKMARLSYTKCLCSIFLFFMFLTFTESVDEVKHSTELQLAIKNGRVSMEEMSALKKPLKRFAKDDRRKVLDIYCFSGLERKDLKRIWTSVTVRLLIPTDKYVVYRSSNASDVYRQYEETAQSWFNMVAWTTDTLSLSVFNTTCMGVDTISPYSIQLHVKMVDPWLVGFLITGIVLFFLAPRLSRNVLFYYGTGISVGLVASTLVVVFILSRFMPKKVGAYAILLGGWSLGLYLLQYVWENIQCILEQHLVYVATYFVTAGLLSFAVLYYKGPVTNPKLINLIKWAIQLVAVLFIYVSTQIPEVSLTIIALVVVKHNFPTSISKSLISFWRRRFPPRIKLLTEEEYDKQGRVETRKALDDLRDYCRSPNCDAWKTISRLNTPQRFASWVEGSSHLSDDEIWAYDSDPMPSPSSDPAGGDVCDIDFRLNSL